MIIALDAGNTNITLGVIEKKKILFTARFATDTKKTVDEYAVFFKTNLELRGIELSMIEGGIISSVVPTVTNILRRAIEAIAGITPLVVGPGVKTGLNILIDNPKQLGSDMVVDAIAASHEYKGPLIILDIGTATTISALDGKGNYLGSVISPGLNISHEALTSYTAQLPHISLEAPENAIGKNTVDAMQSGLVLGHAAMLDGMIDRVEEEMKIQLKTKDTPTVVATGGLARIILPNCRHKIFFDNDLLIKGLLLIYEKNVKNESQNFHQSI